MLKVTVGSFAGGCGCTWDASSIEMPVALTNPANCCQMEEMLVFGALCCMVSKNSSKVQWYWGDTSPMTEDEVYVASMEWTLDKVEAKSSSWRPLR